MLSVESANPTVNPEGPNTNPPPPLRTQPSPFGNPDFPIWEPRKQLKVSRLSVGLAITIPIWEPRFPHLGTHLGHWEPIQLCVESADPSVNPEGLNTNPPAPL
jgi:hypothetical protein